MDKSYEYIDMCYKAKEIQNEWHCQVGDMFWNIQDAEGFNYNHGHMAVGFIFLYMPLGDVSPAARIDGMLDWGRHLFFDTEYDLLYYDEDYQKEWFNTFKQKNIWMPRQDQLQELTYDIGIDNKINWTLKSFCYWFDKEGQFLSLDTGEKIWINFIMKEKYKKTWNGIDWINIEKENKNE